MGGKFLFLTLIAVFLLVTSRAEDDFKEMDVEDIEDEEPEPKIEMDEEARMPRKFRFGGFRFGRKTSRTGAGGGGSTSRGSWNPFGRRTRTNTGGGVGGSRTGSRWNPFGRRTRTNTGGGAGGSRTGRRLNPFARRTRTNTGGQSGSSGGTGTGGGGSSLPSLGNVIGILQLGTDITQTVLTQIGNVERKVVVGLGNKGKLDWTDGTVYMDVGSSLELTPNEVESEQAIQLAGKKPTGVNTKGVAGCMCYKFQFIPKSFCLMFKVPFSGDNYWNVKIYDGTKPANAETFNDLVSSSPIKAGQPVQEKELLATDDYTIYLDNCSMTNSGTSILTVFLGVKIN